MPKIGITLFDNLKYSLITLLLVPTRNCKEKTGDKKRVSHSMFTMKYLLAGPPKPEPRFYHSKFYYTGLDNPDSVFQI